MKNIHKRRRVNYYKLLFFYCIFLRLDKIYFQCAVTVHTFDIKLKNFKLIPACDTNLYSLTNL